MSRPGVSTTTFPAQGSFQLILDSCRRVLSYAEKRHYSGYGKFDALSSPFLKWLSMDKPLLRLLLIQGVMRFPFHIRPLLGVRQSPNPKGLALFALAYLNLFEAYGNASDLEKARSCLQWLLDHPSPGYKELCWGYNFDWQNGRLFYAPRNFPNCVVTVFAAEALLRGHRVTGDSRYLEAARSAARFILTELPVLVDEPERKCLAYVPIKGVGGVINVNALAGAFLAKLHLATGEPGLRSEALRLTGYVVSTQTPYGAWYYTDPPKHSYIRHDNYHTGFILDGILDVSRALETDRFLEAYEQGLDFYVKNLFLPDGTPKYMSDRVYPVDIHGAAQAIITCSAAASRAHPECLDLAVRVAVWTIRRMQRRDGAFCYQRGHLFRRRFTLMRWCNGWMARALSVLVVRLSDAS